MKKSVVKPLAKAEPFKIRGKKWLRLPLLVTLFAIALTLTLIGVIRLPVLATVPNGSQPIAALNTASPSDPFQLYEQGKFEDARKLWEKAADAAVQTGDRLTELRNRINQAQALKSLGAYPRAEQVLKTALAQIDSIQPTQQSGKPVLLELKATLLRSLGDVYQAIGKSNEAYQALGCSLDIAKTLGSKSEISDAYFSLGNTERAEVIRNAVRTLVINSESERSAKLKSALEFVTSAPRLDTCSSKLVQRPPATLKQVFDYFQQAIDDQVSSKSIASIKANLNQFSLLIDILPRLNQFLVKALVLSHPELTTLSRTYFLTDYLKNSPLLTQLEPAQINALLQVVRTLPNEGEPDSRIQDLNRLQLITADLLTQKLPTLLFNIKSDFETLPQSAEIVDIRINYAQSLIRLKPMVDQLSTIDDQLRKTLRTILQEVQFAYAPPAQTKTLPKPAVINPLLKKLTAKQIALFLPQSTRDNLQREAKSASETAIAILPDAIKQAQQSQNQRAEAAAQVSLAEIYGQSAAEKNDLSLWATVEALSQQALRLVQNQDAPDLVFRAQRQYARSLSKQSNKTAARAACRAAATMLQEIRRNLVAVDQDVQYTFRDSVEPFYRDCAESLLPIAGEDLKSQSIQANLEDARNLIESLQLAELDNFFRDACLEGKKVNLDKIIDAQSPTTAVIYPILLSSQDTSRKMLKNQLGVIIKIPKQKDLEYRSFTEDFNIELFLTDLRSQLTSGEYDKQPDANQKSQRVYRWLIEPFKQKFKDNHVKTLVFVLDGAFRGVPMAALYDGQKYLVEDEYAIAVSPSLQLIDSKTPPQTQLNVLAMGLSKPSEAPSRNSFKEPFGDLPSVEEEIKLSGSRRAAPSSGEPVIKLSGDKGLARILPDQKFTITNLKQELNTAPFNVVHLSTHGVFSSRKEETFILAYDQPIFVDQFNDIFQSNRQSQKNPIELLILSACQTAEGDNRAVLGLAGIAFKAGVRSTLATLWAADSAANVTFMNTFYEAIQDNKTKAEAVKIAQQALLKDYKNKPSVWAPYILVGNWS